ncbi:P-loop containing nucleoside triphosphate hydrolase protein [Ceraceosorus guamensis]|uniref:P-loop containing nucleoside triphosphate hydrolase protein n=1 Tax=Ceraceosorus guamensis TaxID=1522189 RepID=A0A316VYI2_9BASI|nr:P-loop containing nucleoside triphosphate hydrolase protein [Ceraceosorus guamensis]PWN41968.1 P-loop containing nucleoside triphosphate hydrolase protein [Ceraceosorus guamensis]
MSSHKVRLIAEHIVKQVARHRSEALALSSRGSSSNAGSHAIKPLLVGMQGPQGSGKTTLTSQLLDELRTARYDLRAAVFSLDDLYLTHADQKALAAAHPGNKLLEGRGQPGTHDVPLGSAILQSIAGMNEASEGGSTTRVLDLPVYDKSAHGGEGDRSGETVKVHAPLDVVIWEGWCMGFGSLEPAVLRDKYDRSSRDAQIGTTSASGASYFTRHPIVHLQEVNSQLASYEATWWAQVDAFVQLAPTPPSGQRDGGPQALETVFTWRLQAERAMKERNGGKGMSDEAVREFVARYMPGYELFGDGVQGVKKPWHGRGLRLGLDSDRNVTEVRTF